MSMVEENVIKQNEELKQMILEWERRYRELSREHQALKDTHRKCLRILAEGM